MLGYCIHQKISRTPCGCVDRNPCKTAKKSPPQVAPLAGAWIEISLITRTISAMKCRTPCGCVDRNSKDYTAERLMYCRTPCGCVDRNILMVTTKQATACRTPCGCVDRNNMLTVVQELGGGRTPCGCVDRNLNQMIQDASQAVVAPLAGAWIEISSIMLTAASKSTSHPLRVRG